MKNILLLDDDPLIHQLVSKVVVSLTYNFFSALTVEEAQAILGANTIDFAICDLFLEGEHGDRLSNDFIRESLIPNHIPYCRLTSEPSRVPNDCSGLSVLDKREFFQNEIKLYELLTSIPAK